MIFCSVQILTEYVQYIYETNLFIKKNPTKIKKRVQIRSFNKMNKTHTIISMFTENKTYTRQGFF